MTPNAAELRFPRRQAELLDRYLDGYRAANALISLGKLAKYVGGVLFVVVVLTAFVFSKTPSVRVGTAWVLAVGIGIGGTVWLVSVVVGLVLHAIGRSTSATLDTAVNTSPFLSNEHRAVIQNLD